MGRNLLMLGLALFVVISMAAILRWFFSRLGAIEKRRWGNMPDRDSIRSSLRRLRKDRKAARKEKKK